MERGRRGGLVDVEDVVDGGRRRDLAFGRERKEGHVWEVGGPVRAKIWGLWLVL